MRLRFGGRGRPRGPRPEQATAPEMGLGLLRIGLVLVLVYAAIAVGMGYWQVAQAGPLTADPGNPLRQAAERSARRGRILDTNGVVLAANVGPVGGAQQRRYPHPAAAPIVGYKSLLFGTSGLERTYDDQLIGLDQLGPGGEMLRKFRPDQSDPSDLELSVDVRLQELAARLLGGDRGAVVAIEPSTGRILALVSNPTFDPNQLVDATTARSYLDKLSADPGSPLLDRATQGRYVPGSVFKMVTAIAALDSGSITPATTFADQPSQYRTGFKVDGFRIRDAPRTVQTDHPLTLDEATEISSNIYFAHVGLQTGAQAMLDRAARLGFGGALDFELPTASSQLTGGGGPLDGFQDDVELANASFGQGQVLATPLQMALVAASIANGGVLMQPKLVDRLVSQNGDVQTLDPHVLTKAMSPATAQQVNDAMVRAVEGPFAAGYAGGAAVDGVTTAGKSGTAQLADGELPHSWFIGFAPAEAPRIAIAVVVENGGFGSERAVPLAGRLLNAYLTRFSPP